ncbi:uncharacterized protein LOC129921419 [Episyrphus balteatus]|uniref:uncharacterized protein LOC129921419 n=1 Tax=Episyrphus balteatus TaxID=286459 RepID=UPI0024866AE8|nr:uncharacterized protein LOC129921419 [Episyrphus balteatus]
MAKSTPVSGASSSGGTLPSTGQTSSGILLPRIDQPKFDGSYVTWRGFHDRFLALVHNNKVLDEIDKLHFLQSCLIVDANRFLQNISVEAANYQKAWELLEERYDHKRILVHIQMQNLFGQPSQTRETASGLQELLYTTRECYLALENMDVPVSTWDTVLIWFIVQKLPSITQKLWEEKPTGTWCSRQKQERANRQQQAAFPACEIEEFPCETISQVAFQASAEDEHCGAVGMQAMQPGEALVEEMSAVPEYGQCATKRCRSSCHFCQQRHNTLLHTNQPSSSTHTPQQQPQPAATSAQANIPSSNALYSSVNPNAPEFQPMGQQQQQSFNYHTSHGDRFTTHQVLLATAVVKARSADGRLRLLRALIDTGSERSFITEAAAQLLKLEKRRNMVEVSGLGLVSSGKTRNSVEVSLASRHSTFEIAIQALVFKSLTGHLPTQRVIPGKWNHLDGLSLADPHLYEPAHIDLLLGSDVCAQIFLPKIKRPLDGIGPIAQNTQLGWIVLGKVPAEIPRQVRNFLQIAELCTQMEKFCEMEEMPFQTHETLDNIACDEHFSQHTRRLPDGRYEVKLPFKGESLPAMGSSRQGALRRLQHLEKKLDADPRLFADYTKCIKEYEDLNHMEEIDPNDPVLATPYHYFLPHHAVFKEASSTTKLRVVFDAASKALDGKSLNDSLLVGPKLQTSIIDLVLRWRTHRVTFTADIEKMYRQILVSFPDRYYQLIMWREQRTSPVQIFKMNTVTFGTASAPYLAIKILKKVADDESDNFPEGAKVVREDMYVDDLISGADSIEEARKKRDEASQLLSSAGLNLRKWTSNVKELVEDIPVQDRELDFELPFNWSNHVKTLGIKWFPIDDCFSYQNLQPSTEATTKRSILSTIAKLFDPLGWISPCVVTSKIIMQRLWNRGCNRDDPIPSALMKDWEAFHRELPLIERLRIPRWTHISLTNMAIELHGFCDASMKAYGAAVYVRVLDSNGNIHVNLILSKTRVAPSKRTITLPRLELCGAVVLAQLLQYIKEVLAIPNVKMYSWTDSTIALAWIRATPAKWTTFVSNRVSEIQRLVGIDCWGHVGTLHNPADLASRGVLPSELQSLQTWWNGPEFLHRKWDFDSPDQPVETDTEEEKRTVKVLTVHVLESDNILQAIFNSSNLLRATRVITTCVRFIIKCRPKLYGIITGSFYPWELELARLLMVKAAQSEMFETELSYFKANSKMPKSLSSLNAFIDIDGILRVGGRLENSLLSYDAQHPILLRNNHHFTTLVVREAHKNTLHGGIQQMISYIRQRYWIGQIRRSVKYQLFRCTSCFRQKASEMQQLLGNLPAARVRMARPFSHTGVDYAGPIDIKSWKARGAKILKGYFAVFICLATKAIHLEVVSDLTTQAFLAAFRRFTARRGSCQHVYSDCGTNFVGANNELAKMLNEAKHDFKEIATTLANYDASNEALGAVLSQGKVGSDKPIAYASRSLSKTEKRYSTIEREALAVVWAVNNFRSYLLGRVFTVYTDHQPLKGVFHVKDPTARLCMFRHKLSEYVFKIEYKPGKLNTNADALSCIPHCLAILSSRIPQAQHCLAILTRSKASKTPLLNSPDQQDA